MTLITLQDGVVVMRDDKVGTGAECCCGDCRCNLVCCPTLQGRNACEGGTEIISDFPPEVVNWGLNPSEASVTDAGWIYLSDALDQFLQVIIEPCADGVIAIDVILNEHVPGGSPVASSRRRWANATAILGEDGCPTGVDLGELTESEGPEPAITLELGFICT